MSQRADERIHPLKTRNHFSVLLLYGLSCCLVEAGYLFYPGKPLLWTLLKLSAFVFLSLRLFGCRPAPPAGPGIAAVLLYECADLLISWNLIAGGIMYAAGHICLFAASSQRTRIRPIGFLIWILVSVPTAVLLFCWFRFSPLLGAGIAVYSSLLLGATVFAFQVSPRIRFGTILFLLSDAALAVHFLHPVYRAAQVLGIILFYLSLLLIEESARCREI